VSHSNPRWARSWSTLCPK